MAQVQRVVHHTGEKQSDADNRAHQTPSGMRIEPVKPYGVIDIKKKAEGIFPSARRSVLDVSDPLLFLPLHGLLGAAAPVIQQQSQCAFIKVALAGLKHGHHVFFRLVFGVNLLQPLPQDRIGLFRVVQPDFHNFLVIPDVHLQIKPASLTPVFSSCFQCLIH